MTEDEIKALVKENADLKTAKQDLEDTIKRMDERVQLLTKQVGKLTGHV